MRAGLSTASAAAGLALSALVGPAPAAAQPGVLPYWALPGLDPFVWPYGGAGLLANVTWTRLYLATPAVGTYAMSPMLSYLNGRFLASYKLSPSDEDQPGQKVMWSQSTDGVTWTPTGSSNVLFPSMNSTENPRVALFAEPSIWVNGHVYAAASPIQFCLYPDQYQDRLLLRRIFDDGTFGPIFWASTTIPTGFDMASAANNVTTVLQQDAETQLDISTLTPTAVNPPCPPSGSSGTSKCEFCPGGCQPWAIPLNVSSLENERSHYSVPNSTVDVLLYRSHNRVLYASTRQQVGLNWTVPVPTTITDTVANFNAGNLPDGRPYLVSNAMITLIRDPIYLSISSNGWAFDSNAAIGSCEQSEIFANPPEQPWGCLYRYQGGAKEGGIQYPQAALVTQPGVEGLYVIASVNKEDIWVAKVPLSSIPAA
jgi:hypothetical protein